MPITYHLKPDYRLIIFVHTGVVSDDELLSFNKKFFEDIPFDKTFNKLIDLRGEENTARSPEVLKKIAEIVHSQYENSSVRLKIAVIAPKDLFFGLGRMFGAYISNPPFNQKVFRTANEALKWLEIPENLLDNLTS